MKLKMAGLAVVALACAAGAAQAQPYGDDRRGGGWGDNRPGSGWDNNRGGQITLYPNPDFRGRGFAASQEYSNLPKPYNDGAMSLEVRGGAWEVCVDSNFRGRCQVVTRDVRDLRSIGLSGTISSVRPARGGGDWGPGPGGPPPGGGWGPGGPGGPGGGRGSVITLFSGDNFQGRAFSTSKEYSNLPRENNDRTYSLRIEGRGAWEVCSDANFKGRCQVFNRDVPNLNIHGLAEAISSIRPVN